MRVIFLNIYGITFKIYGRRSSTIDKLIFEDLNYTFAHFIGSVAVKSPEVTIVLVPKIDRKSFSTFKKVYWDNGPTIALRVFKKRRLIYCSRHPNAAAYLENFINSCAGELLEKQNWFRIHAAGIVEAEKMKIWLAPRGAGKSVRTVTFLTQTTCPIAADEQVFFFEQTVYSYPLPIATVKPVESSKKTRVFMNSIKYLAAIPPERIAKPTPSFEILFVCDSRWKLFAFIRWFTNVILGLGLPQMRVYLVRRDNLMWLIKQAFKRAGFAWWLLKHEKIKVVTLAELRNAKHGND